MIAHRKFGWPARIVFAVVALVAIVWLALDGRRSAAATPPPQTEASPAAGEWAHVDDAPKYSIAGGKSTVTMLTRGGAYMGILTGKPGLTVPEHVHAGSIEMLFVQKGGGWMTIDGRREKVRAGMAIQIPAGVKHAFAIPADWVEGDFEAVQVYTPAGPEARFEQGTRLDGARAPGAQP